MHILSPQLDLVDIKSVYGFAERLVRGTVSNPPDEDGMADNLTDVRVPRLDAVIFNAGFGGWDGLDWFGMARMCLFEGVVQAVTWPDFKVSSAGAVVKQKGVVKKSAGKESGSAAGEKDGDKDVLGAVFCSNVFGHYVLGHALLPLLARRDGDIMSPGKIIWTSSIEPSRKDLHLDDLQCIKRPSAYESSKRLTDVLALTCTLPSVFPVSKNYFRLPSRHRHRDNDDQAKQEEEGDVVEECYRPRVYLTHPGVLATTLFPLPSWLFLLYRFALLFVRWLGSPWHTVDGYAAAVAPVTLTLETQDVLDEEHAERVKWGSACNRFGRTAAKKTEVDGWGWEGKIEGDVRRAKTVKGEEGFLRKSVGRWAYAKDLTEEDRAQFEGVGRECWAAMERLRLEWEERLGVKAVGLVEDDEE